MPTSSHWSSAFFLGISVWCHCVSLHVLFFQQSKVPHLTRGLGVLGQGKHRQEMSSFSINTVATQISGKTKKHPIQGYYGRTWPYLSVWRHVAYLWSSLFELSTAIEQGASPFVLPLAPCSASESLGIHIPSEWSSKLCHFSPALSLIEWWLGINIWW